MVPQPEQDRRGGIAVVPSRMDRMDPTDIRPRAVAAVNNHSGASILNESRHLASFVRQPRSRQLVTIQGLWNPVPDDARMSGELRVHTVTDKMYLSADAMDQMPSQLVVGSVHAAPGSEVPAHKDVSGHNLGLRSED